MNNRSCFFAAILHAVAIVAPVCSDDILSNNVPNIDYRSYDGVLSVTTDGADMVSLLLEGPKALSIDRWTDGSDGDGVQGWSQRYFNGKEQWVGVGSALSGRSVNPGTYDIATYATNLRDTDFGEVEIGTQSFGTLFTYVNVISGLPEDFNGDGEVNFADIDLLSAAIRTSSADPMYDLNLSGTVDEADHSWLVHGELNTWFGDANLDGEFNSSDLVQVFVVGRYESEEPAGWAEGDWDGNGLFDSSDMVTAFADGGYEQGVRPDAVAVPEPMSVMLLVMGLIGLAIFRRPLGP